MILLRRRSRVKEGQAWVTGKETGGKTGGIFLVYHPPGQGHLAEFCTSLSGVIRKQQRLEQGVLVAEQEDPTHKEELVLVCYQSGQRVS